MNELYTLVDSVIKDGPQQDSIQALRKKAKKEDQEMGKQLSIPYNVEYILKRFVNACMSTDPAIRKNASTALSSFSHMFPIEVEQDKLVDMIIGASNYQKSHNKKSESQGFASGRILAFKALAGLVADNVEAFNSLKEVLGDNPHLEQDVMEVCFLISQGKVLRAKFHSFSPKSEVSRFLYRMLLGSKDPSAPIPTTEIDSIISKQVERFPAHSLALEYFGRNLKSYCEAPSQFFNHYGNKFLDNEADVDIHEIYYVLIIFKSFLEAVTIDSNNYEVYFSKKMVAVWLEQLRVMNRNMKELATSITINFNEEPELAYKALVALHEDGVYLENISVNHPLQQLYSYVDASRYWGYIYGLCVEAEGKDQESKELEQQIEQEAEHNEAPMSYFNEMQFFIKTHQKQLPLNEISKALILLLNNFHFHPDNKEVLYLVINLMGCFCDYKRKNNKKKELETRHKLFANMIKVLKKVKISQLAKVEEGSKTQIKKCLLWLKKKSAHVWEQGREDCPLPEISFYVFYAALIFFVMIYPDEIETLQELQPVFEDLAGLYEVREAPKKKVKKQRQEEDPKKPIHVLVDIFISLMTKPPGFLREAIHSLYEVIIPFLEQSDLVNLMTVITTPDAEFIQEV